MPQTSPDASVGSSASTARLIEPPLRSGQGEGQHATSCGEESSSPGNGLNSPKQRFFVVKEEQQMKGTGAGLFASNRTRLSSPDLLLEARVML